MVTFNQEDILKALTRLGELANATHHSVELLVTGGALMVLAYQSRLATKDIDALILSPQAALVRKWIQQVAQEQELPDDWLNDAVKPFLVTVSPGPVVFQTTGLKLKAQYALEDLWRVYRDNPLESRGPE